jgi:antitoxin HicB
MNAPERPNRGSSLADLLKEDGTYEAASSRATMRAVSENLKHKFEQSSITRTDFAKRMGTSRTVVNRLLDGRAESVTVKTLVKAANALGVTIRFEVADLIVSKSR